MIKRNPYKFRGPETWALAKEAYLAGETCASIARRLDVGESAMKRRMKNEGWTRRDHAAALDALQVRRQRARTPAALQGAEAFGAEAAATQAARPEPAEPPPDLSAAQLAQQAVRRAAQALTDGRTADARALSAMAESLSRTAAREPKTGLELILRALTDTAFRTELFRVDPDNPDDPDLPIKKIYWGRSPDSPW
jgi:hypothetical protein